MITLAQRPAAPRLDALYASIRSELAAVESILRCELRSDYAFVDELAQHSFHLGGKRLRPALVLLSAKAAGGIREEHLTVAAVVELIHTATLVHDDVLDEAALRRHLDTVNARWGNEASVLLGDYLFTHAFYLASTLPTTFACRVIGRATNIVCEGELRQVAQRADYGLTEAEYLGIIDAKTAELCACCCLLGAHYARANDDAEQALSDYGRHVGIAFQITDDLLDILGDEPTVGKSLGTDLEKQKPTLPLIHALRQAGSADRDRILSILRSEENHRRDALFPWLERYDSLSYARGQAASHVAQATAALASLPATPAKNLLASIADFVITRRL